MTKIKLETKFDIADVLANLSSIVIREGERIAWSSQELERSKIELIYGLQFKPKVEDYIKDGAIWHSINECARKNDFSQKTFSRFMIFYVNSHQEKKKQRYNAVCQINSRYNQVGPLKINTPIGVVHITDGINKKDHAILTKRSPDDLKQMGFHDSHQFIRCAVDSVDDRTAVNLAHDRMLFALGLLNMYFRGFGVSIRSGFPSVPIGQYLISSSILIVDRKNLKEGAYFINGEYPDRWRDSFTVKFHQKVDKFEKFSEKFSKSVKKLDYSKNLIDAVILFQRGLEATSIDIALLRFWTGIEILCSKDSREPAQNAVDRASSNFRDSKRAKIRLEFMQEYRNNIVHKGRASDYALLCAQWGSIYLAELIMICVFNRHFIKNKDTLLNYMSLPKDEVKIKKSIELLKKRLRVVAGP